jgi:hypothetical protein
MTVTFLSNITYVMNQEVCLHQLLFGCKPKLPASLRTFGEIGVITTKDKIQGKLKNRGTPCIFVGFSAHHAHDVYRMLNFETEMIIDSRDIIWLNHVHKVWILNKPNNQPNYDDNDGVEVMIQSVNTDQNAPEDVKDHDELKRIKRYKQMCRLECSFNPDAAQVVEQFEQGREILFDQANIALFTGSAINKEPTTFNLHGITRIRLKKIGAR